ncbi:protein kinase [bacterium]|nr:protein kinase [bacterium]
MALCLALGGDARPPTTYICTADQVRLGRSSDNDIIFDPDHDAGVSRHHAVIRKNAQGGWNIHDLDSRHGTLRNGWPVKGEEPLSPRDVLRLGTTGPQILVLWRRKSDKDTSTYSMGLDPAAPQPFPLALYRDFPDRFSVFQKIGTGGYGEVWRGRTRRSAEWVAVKFLRRELLRSAMQDREEAERIIRRFRREAELTQRLAASRVKGIARMDEAGGNPDEGFLYMILEYVDGKSLERLVGQWRDFPYGRFCRYMAQTAEALSAAHRFEWVDMHGRQCRGIVHRDVKPSNILIRKRDDHAVLCDFGIAGIEVGGDRLTRSHVCVSTFRYTAPEVFRTNAITPSTDLWGLAVTAYVMFSGGYYPYDGATARDVINEVDAGRLIPLTDYRGDLPPELVDLIHRGLSPHPAFRPETAAEWADRLWVFAEV